MKQAKTVLLLLFLFASVFLYSQEEIPFMTAWWDFYMFYADDAAVSVFLNLDLIDYAPVEDYTNVCIIRVEMKYPNPDGLSSNRESDILWDLEDKIIEHLMTEYDAIHPGRITSGGSRFFYFYFKDTNLDENRLDKIISGVSDYEYEVSFLDDPYWELYFDFLYPTARDMQTIQNRLVLYSLEDSGDSLTEERRVDHWIYFNSTDERFTFIKEITKQGFTVESVSVLDDMDTYKYEVQIYRNDMVDYLSIDEYTLYLFDLAEYYNGYYDGWETYVVK